METRLVLVALAVAALGCGETQVVTDAGSDAEVVDLGGLDVAMDDAGEAEPDAGWCLDSPCIQRLRLGGECVESVRSDFPCDDDDERTYEDRCSAVGVCEGTACECDVAAGCCDGCSYMAPGSACTTAPPFNNPASCVDVGAGITACQGPPITP